MLFIIQKISIEIGNKIAFKNDYFLISPISLKMELNVGIE